VAVGLLRRLAAARPAPVFVALGMQAGAVRETLALDPRVELVDSPRHASVLLVAGGVPPDQQEALRRLHDQLPRPAASLWFRSEPFIERGQAQRVDDRAALPEALAGLHRDLLEGARPAAPHLLPDQPPHPWKGQGMHGQGGEGMMGGMPYGRPMAMAMMDDVRDGLMLDSLSFTLGPFYPALPPGLQLKLTLQGDLLQMAMIESRTYPAHASPLFFAALERPVPIAELEIERARHHLRRLAHVLQLGGLGALARRTLADAARIQPGVRLPDLHRRVARSGLLQAIDPGLGRLEAAQAYALGGSAYRATGSSEDARASDPSYACLGFRPITGEGGDAHARLFQWVAEIEQALALAAAAHGQSLATGTQAQVETPRGAMTAEQRPADGSHLLMELLPGLEWSQALLLIASLDLAALSPYPADQGAA
jgi:hypothetical protein